MKRSIKLPILIIGMSLSWLASVTAQEEGPAPLPVIEIFGCNFNAGSDMSDLLAVTARWNAWADRNDVTDYTAVILTPYLYSEELGFDVLWLGAWPSGAAMGAGEALWLAEGGDLRAEFAQVADCVVHSHFASFNVRVPSAPPPEAAFVRFMECTLNEGRVVPEAISALRRWTEYLAGTGTDMFGAMLFPLAGESSEADYSFKWVEGFRSAEDHGEFIDTYTGGGFRTAEELFGRLMACNSPRVYWSNRVRAPAD